jgi:hypothetical protein
MPELTTAQKKAIKRYFKSLSSAPNQRQRTQQAHVTFQNLLTALFNLSAAEAEAITTYFLLDQRPTVNALKQHPKRTLLENGVLMACFFLTWLSTPTGNWQIMRLGATQGFLAPALAMDFTGQHSVIARHFAQHLADITYRPQVDAHTDQAIWAFIRNTLADTIEHTFCQGAYARILNTMIMLNIYRSPDNSGQIGGPTIAFFHLQEKGKVPHNVRELDPAARALRTLTNDPTLLSSQQGAVMIYGRSNRYTAQHFPCLNITSLLCHFLVPIMLALTGYSAISSETDLNPAHLFAAFIGMCLIAIGADSGFIKYFPRIFAALPGQVAQQLELTIDSAALNVHLAAPNTSAPRQPVLWPHAAGPVSRFDPKIVKKFNAQQQAGATQTKNGGGSKMKTRGIARPRLSAPNGGGGTAPAAKTTPAAFNAVIAQKGAARGNTAELLLPPFDQLEKFDRGGDDSAHEQAYNRVGDGRKVVLLQHNLPKHIYKIKIGAHGKKDCRFYAVADATNAFIVVGYYGSHKSQLNPDAMRRKFNTLNKAHQQSSQSTESHTKGL